jgi:membrane protease YdiL (CAAX protease family)
MPLQLPTPKPQSPGMSTLTRHAGMGRAPDWPYVPEHAPPRDATPNTFHPDTAGGSRARRGLLTFEYAALFFVLPALAATEIIDLPVIALVWSAGLVCLLWLLFDKSFDRAQFWTPGPIRPQLWRSLPLWLAATLGLGLLVYFFRPHEFLYVPREYPVRWALAMVLYPILSVYPQSIVYRGFIFHRYRSLFTNEWSMIWASASAFAFAHVIFHNWIALGLTMIGGLVFAHAYARSRSMLLSAILHAIYGCTVFTIGLGWAIYKP